MYPVVFFDALRVKIREDAVVRNKAAYLALGILRDGTREILGLWVENACLDLRCQPPKPASHISYASRSRCACLPVGRS